LTDTNDSCRDRVITKNVRLNDIIFIHEKLKNIKTD
jgi:hypothetical protein